MIPIEIVNKILVYVADLNNAVVVTQYRPYTNKECYNINFKSDILWKIKASLLMKKFYPMRDAILFKTTPMTWRGSAVHIRLKSGATPKGTLELYKCGISHYEGLLRRKIFE